MKPYLGQAVIFVPRPGSARAGHSELAAIVTRVLSDNAVSLYVLMDDPRGEIWHQDRVPPMTQERQTNCWRPVDAGAEIAELRQMVEDLTAPPKRAAKG